MASHPNYSLLQSRPLRSLPVALAHQLAATRPGDPYLRVLGRLYSALPHFQQAQCRAELDRRH